MLVLLAGIFVVHIATVVMLFVCTIANVWVVSDAGQGSVGLWKNCTSAGCTDTLLYGGEDALKSVQAFMILSIIFSVVSLVVFVFQLFTMEKGNRFFLSGATMLVCCEYLSSYTGKAVLLILLWVLPAGLNRRACGAVKLPCSVCSHGHLCSLGEPLAAAWNKNPHWLGSSCSSPCMQGTWRGRGCGSPYVKLVQLWPQGTQSCHSPSPVTLPQYTQLGGRPWSFFFFFFFFFCFLGPNLRHMEVPRLGVQSEL
uniref:Epithelial membrane protein 1 n=1 Tax=Sus scrofa TaxID=9823 RepID=A0A8D1KQJ2_PIG